MDMCGKRWCLYTFCIWMAESLSVDLGEMVCKVIARIINILTKISLLLADEGQVCTLKVNTNTKEIISTILNNELIITNPQTQR